MVSSVEETWYVLLDEDGEEIDCYPSAKAAKGAKAQHPGSRVQMMATVT
jgi:hypothetical protein